MPSSSAGPGSAPAAYRKRVNTSSVDSAVHRCQPLVLRPDKPPGQTGHQAFSFFCGPLQFLSNVPHPSSIDFSVLASFQVCFQVAVCTRCCCISHMYMFDSWLKTCAALLVLSLAKNSFGIVIRRCFTCLVPHGILKLTVPFQGCGNSEKSVRSFVVRSNHTFHRLWARNQSMSILVRWTVRELLFRRTPLAIRAIPVVNTLMVEVGAPPLVSGNLGSIVMFVLLNGLCSFWDGDNSDRSWSCLENLHQLRSGWRPEPNSLFELACWTRACRAVSEAASARC